MSEFKHYFSFFENKPKVYTDIQSTKVDIAAGDQRFPRQGAANVLFWPFSPWKLHEIKLLIKIGVGHTPIAHFYPAMV